MTGLPSISVITPSYNQGAYLEETLRSVLGQRYPNLQYLVIDGGSTDDSVGIIRRYEAHLAYWVSEKDRGQVEAINKGLARADGEVVAFLNSDDVYLPGALLAVGDHFRRHPGCEWVCGETLFFGEGFPTCRPPVRTPRSAAHCLSWAYKAAQPGMFWERAILDRGFDERWPYDFDHEMYVRLLLAGRVCDHLPLPVAGYRLHPGSKTVAENHRQEEEFDAIAEHYEPLLRGAGRRWSKATRYLRSSYRASEYGRKAEAARWLMRALWTYPEGLAGRPFWGTLRRLARRGRSPAGLGGVLA
jgi:glycosyltransferase involved in cell wall biosynthesis